jgi:hypothetical protein
MKTIINIATGIVMIIILFTSCKKEPIQLTPPPLPPISGSQPPITKNTEYNLDITLNTTYKFYDNISDPWGYATWSSSFDLTEILGKANLPPLGEFNISVNEIAAAAPLSDTIYACFISISIPGSNTPYISGDCSINFKKLIRVGGGAFNGTLKITNGSAQIGDPNIFSRLPPLTVTGTLDANTHIVNLRIKGKTYF